jgi:hypothetical protein
MQGVYAANVSRNFVLNATDYLQDLTRTQKNSYLHPCTGELLSPLVLLIACLNVPRLGSQNKRPHVDTQPTDWKKI